mmetsp:Transcript_5253/g.7262  ORF Transcript_5253/g.7262 Transcript_5253/m.7262 type:complete len:233 (-) Transcript_5253:317-1015(-)
MALVNVTNVIVLDNPTAFTNPFQFEVTFECLQQLEDDLEWKVIYVGNAESSSEDQALEEVMVGPVPVGVNKFVLQADPPDSTLIPEDSLLGVTVVLVTCSYRESEFLRVGYYVNNEFQFTPEEIAAAEEKSQQMAQQQPTATPQVQSGNGSMSDGGGGSGAEADGFEAPANHPESYLPEVPRPIDLSRVQRNILADKPRVTRFPIDWAPRGAMNNDSLMSFRSDNDSLMETS